MKYFIIEGLKGTIEPALEEFSLKNNVKAIHKTSHILGAIENNPMVFYTILIEYEEKQKI